MQLEEIESIVQIGQKNVYDISMLVHKQVFLDSQPNFIANNIVVHNCHASGIVISPFPIGLIAPTRQAKKVKDQDGNDTYAYGTQYDKDDAQSIGLIKMDYLGIAALPVIANTVNTIKQNYGIDIDIQKLKDNDKNTLALYRSGKLTGVFQCENFGMQKTMRQVGVDNFDDITAVIALYRPGPMDSIPDYCDRKKGLKPVSYFHPTIQKHIKKYMQGTYGVLVYQQQVMQVLQAIANFTVVQGYLMIKAVGKKKPQLMQKYQNQFYTGAVANGVPRQIAQSYWHKIILPFSSYGFNKSLDEDTLIPSVGGLKKIKDFVSGDQVFSVNQNGDIVTEKVVNLHDHGYLNGYQVFFQDGSSVTCSQNHKFLTKYGQMKITDIIKEGHDVLGIYTQQGDIYASKEIRDCKMWDGNRQSGKTKTSSGQMSSLRQYGVEEKIEWSPSNSQISMRNKDEYSKVDILAQKSVRKMQDNKKIEHPKEDGQVKLGKQISLEKENIVIDSKKDICSSIDSKTKIGQTEKMEKIESVGVLEMCGRYAQKPQRIKDVDLVEVDFKNEFCKNSVRLDQEINRYSQRVSMDIGGRILSFQLEPTQGKTGQKDENIKRCSVERSHNEQVGYEQGYYDDTCQHVVLSQINRKDEGLVVEDVSGYAKVSDTRNLVLRKIVRIMPVGVRRMYDLEIACSTHNFFLDNGVVTSNSHSAGYAVLSYQTAYLKANYTQQYFASLMDVISDRKDFDKMEEIQKDLKNFNIRLGQKRINQCGVKYLVSKKRDVQNGEQYSIISPSLMCKGVGLKPAQNIEKNKPYKDLRDIALKTDSRIVTSDIINSLVQDGWFDAYVKIGQKSGKGKMTKQSIVNQFVAFRQDAKKAMKKGIDPSQDGIF